MRESQVRSKQIYVYAYNLDVWGIFTEYLMVTGVPGLD